MMADASARAKRPSRPKLLRTAHAKRQLRMDQGAGACIHEESTTVMLSPAPMTVAEFLAWEEVQELRWEFDGSAPVAMTGGTVAHEIIPLNLVAALNTSSGGTR